MPASITGCSISRMSVSRVRMRLIVGHPPDPTRTGSDPPAEPTRRSLPVRGGAWLGPDGGSVGEIGAAADEHVAGPAARGQHGGPGVVLEQPAGEVAAGPGREPAEGDGGVGSVLGSEHPPERPGEPV